MTVAILLAFVHECKPDSRQPLAEVGISHGHLCRSRPSCSNKDAFGRNDSIPIITSYIDLGRVCFSLPSSTMAMRKMSVRRENPRKNSVSRARIILPPSTYPMPGVGRLVPLGSRCRATPKRRNPRRSMAPASTRRTLGRYPFHTTSPRSNQGEWIHSPSDVGTEPIHFHQECTASTVHPEWTWRRNPFISPKMITTQSKGPTHDAPIGSRTPATTGEDDPRKEWKVLVTFSVTPGPMEHSSDLRAKTRSLLWPDCTLSPLSPKVESEPVGDPVVSDPMYPRGIHLSCDRTLTLLGRNRRSCPPRA